MTRSSKEQETIMLSCERKLTGTMKEESNESTLTKSPFTVLSTPLKVFMIPFDRG